MISFNKEQDKAQEKAKEEIKKKKEEEDSKTWHFFHLEAIF